MYSTVHVHGHVHGHVHVHVPLSTRLPSRLTHRPNLRRRPSTLASTLNAPTSVDARHPRSTHRPRQRSSHPSVDARTSVETRRPRPMHLTAWTHPPAAQHPSSRLTRVGRLLQTMHAANGHPASTGRTPQREAMLIGDAYTDTCIATSTMLFHICSLRVQLARRTPDGQHSSVSSCILVAGALTLPCGPVDP